MVVKFVVPEYIRGQHAGYVYLGGANYESTAQSPVSGATAAYLNMACTELLTWEHSDYYGDYFIAPDILYFKMKAGQGGSDASEVGGVMQDYSLLDFQLQYASADTLSIYQ